MFQFTLCIILTAVVTSTNGCSNSDLNIEWLRNNSLVSSSLVRRDVDKFILALTEAISKVLSQVKSEPRETAVSQPVDWISAISLMLILLIKVYGIVGKWRQTNQHGFSTGGGIDQLSDG